LLNHYLPSYQENGSDNCTKSIFTRNLKPLLNHYLLSYQKKLNLMIVRNLLCIMSHLQILYKSRMRWVYNVWWKISMNKVSQGSKSQSKNRGAPAPSHGSYSILHIEMTSHWLTVGEMQLMHRCTCFGCHIELVQLANVCIALWFLCVPHKCNHDSELAPLC